MKKNAAEIKVKIISISEKIKSKSAYIINFTERRRNRWRADVYFPDIHKQ